MAPENTPDPEAFREFMECLESCKALLTTFREAAKEMWTVAGCIADDRDVNGTPLSQCGYVMTGRLTLAALGAHILVLKTDVSPLSALVAAIDRFRDEASPILKASNDGRGNTVDVEDIARLRDLYDDMLPRIDKAWDCLDTVYLEGMAAEVACNVRTKTPAGEGGSMEAASPAQEVKSMPVNDEPENNKVTPPEQVERYVFRRCGDMWEIQFNEERGSFPKAKGFQHIQRLLQSPDKHISALELMGVNTAKLTVSTDGGGERIDEEAKAQVKQEIDQLQKELDDTLNQERRAELEDQIESFKMELVKSTALFGKKRQLQKTPGDKAANAVKAAIDRAVQEITAFMPCFAKHLKEQAQTGQDCIYLATNDVKWSFM